MKRQTTSTQLQKGKDLLELVLVPAKTEEEEGIRVGVEVEVGVSLQGAEGAERVEIVAPGGVREREVETGQLPASAADPVWAPRQLLPLLLAAAAPLYTSQGGTVVVVVIVLLVLALL